jgi:FkbM family methyltransferase
VAEEVRLIERDGYWWPDYDADYPGLTYALQRNAKDIAVSAALCRKRKLCVQAGGHIGIWPLALAWMFDGVITFEPQPAAFAALGRNIAHEHRRIRAFPFALGEYTGRMRMQAGQNSATWRRVEAVPLFPQVSVEQRTIDDMVKKSEDVGAIYLDVEGGELAAILGGMETIRRCKPVLHLEVFEQNRAELEAVVFALGYKFVRTVHKDSVYVPA